VGLIGGEAAVKGAAEVQWAAGTKRKSTSSRGVEALKKVNTTSMNKLTSFFKPKEKS
jgi:ribonuclease H2 subunit B